MPKRAEVSGARRPSEPGRPCRTRNRGRPSIPALMGRFQLDLMGNGLLFLLAGAVARVTSLIAPCASFLTPLRTRFRRLSGRRGGRGAGLGSSI
jgi:hypothetical protein